MDQLKLSNQICFPLYTTSRMVIKAYQPFLKDLGITYPQYLVMLVLWENDGLTVNSISKRLYLETNTITPLLKRMESSGILSRKRSKKDERVVEVFLTKKGQEMKKKAEEIPNKLFETLKTDSVSNEEFAQLQSILNRMMEASKT